jgi:serine/threonine protein kinase
MPLSPATRLGPYEIIVAIGAGGMGEVYRARDTRLDRIVAIKVLSEHLSSNPQSRERFDREAKAISSLSHPHICPLYDVGRQNGIDYLVMEYLEGETLASRLKKGPLPPDHVLQYAIQITDALDTAHRHGVIHRDLKPGNIMLTKSGVKLLDFGLAKVRAVEAVAGMTALPTQTTPLTGEGTILGTLQYMAPEQLEYKGADARTDIFALGAVMYETATGRKAFTGKSRASLVSAIMSTEPPPLSTLQPASPPAMDRVISKCLAKDPAERWQSARDLRYVLEGISTLSIAAAPARGDVPSRGSLPRWHWPSRQRDTCSGPFPKSPW